MTQPFRAQMIGHGMVRNICVGRWPRSMNSRSEMSSTRSPIWPVSRPEEKLFPSPRQTIARRSGISWTSARTSQSRRSISSLMALCFSGRLLVMTATGPSTSRRTRSRSASVSGGRVSVALVTRGSVMDGSLARRSVVGPGLERAGAGLAEGPPAELLADRGEGGLHGVAALPVGAVDDQRVPGDVGGVGRAEVGGGPGQLPGVPDPARRHPVVLALVLAGHGGDGGDLVLVGHEPGHQAVDPDAVGGPLDRRASRPCS